LPKVSIIGAGDVGASIAYTLQLSGLATEIMLVDVDRDRALGHVMDMNHGLFFTPPAHIAAGDYPDCSGSDLIIVTAGARQRRNETRLDLVQKNVEIIKDVFKRARAFIGSAKILMVTNPVDVMTYVMLKISGLEPNRIFGSGTVLDSARFRYQLSDRCTIDPRNVHAYVIGEHGDSEVLLWSQVRMAGLSMEAFCGACGRGCQGETRGLIEKEVRNSAYHVIEIKGFTNYGVSLAVRRITTAVLRNELSVLTVSTLLDGEYGLHGVCLSVPCILGQGGVERIVTGTLANEEEEGLRRSAGVIGSALHQLEGIVLKER